MRNVIILIAGITILAACEEVCTINEDIQSIPVEIQVERLEEQLFAASSKEEIKQLLDNNYALKKFFLVSDQYPHDSILVNSLYRRIRNPHIDTLYQEAKEVFGDFQDLKNQFEEAFKHIKFYYPETTVPKIQTFVSGMGSSELYVSDSLIIIGLDYYIGPEATFRPLGYPNYILKRFQKEYIVPAAILLLSNKYIQENYQDKTMLADMLYYGKKYYFADKVLPCTPDSLLIWYSGQELEDVNENQDIIWANFVVNDLLFETNHITKRKYLDERPKVFEIGDKCPGRIGAWLGWQIVEQYMDQNEEITLQELMKNTDNKQIFQDSNYKPDKPGLLF